MLRLAVCAALAALSVPRAFAAQPAGLVPHPTQTWTNAAIDAARTNAQQLTIQQTQSKAVLNWSQFNVRPGESVNFEQQAASWAALNRIHQADPSRIQGSINARGQVYLINQNGIVFANGAQVNVGGLVASTVDISDTLFNAGILSNRQPGQVPAFASATLPAGTVVVESGAELKTAREGRIMLIGKDVSNNGLISTPDGQTVLAAGGKVYLAASTDPTLRGLLVEVDNGGTVSNLPLGKIVAERGNVTMVGLAVKQSGRVSATTSVNLNGSIRLLARDTVAAKEPEAGVQIPLGGRGGDVRLGTGSLTEVKAEIGSSETSKDNQTFNRSRVEVAGQTIRMDAGSAIVAPSGSVTLTAQRGLDFQAPGTGPDAGVRIYLDKGSVIDVSGTQNVTLPMARNVIDVELRGTELADAPLQRDGVLRGKTIQVDIRKGTPVADIAGNLAQIARGVDERTTTGGSVALRSEGDIVLRDGSVIDVSGGSVRYLDGPIKTTRLLAADGSVVDIGDASPNRVYKEIVDGYTVSYAKWGVTEVFALPARIEAGYVDGANAGSIAILAHAAVLDGSLVGRAAAGRLQRQSGQLPLGATLTIGDSGQAALAAPSFKMPDVNFVFATSRLPTDFGFAMSEAPGSPVSPLPDPMRTTLQVPVGTLRSGGFSRLAIYSDGEVRIADDQMLELEAGGSNGRGASLTLFGRSIRHDGAIVLPGGTVTLRTVQPLNSVRPLAADYELKLGATSRISTAGAWINDHPAVTPLPGTAPAVVDGGSIVLGSVSNLVLAPGSALDVSAGAWRQVDGKLKLGAAGSIALGAGRFNRGPFDPQTSTIELGSALSGFGFGKGGALTIDTSRVQLGGAGAATAALKLDAGFFQRGGFSSFQINGQDGLTVAEGSRIELQNVVRTLSSRFASAATGTNIAEITALALLPEALRNPASLTLSANSTVFGDVLIAAGARLDAGVAGTLSVAAGRQLTVLGELVAPGGTISLTTADPRSRDFDPTQSVWLGPQARIDARGAVRTQTDDRGLRSGEVLAGGTVTISARSGYFIAERGSVIDVSAASAPLDIVTVVGQARAPTQVHGDAGTITIAAQEGILLDGALKAAPSSPGAGLGGNLTLALDPAVPNNPSYPTVQRRVMVGERMSAVPATLRPGQSVDPLATANPAASALNHRVLYSTGAFDDGGFDRIVLRSPDVIEFTGNAHLDARISLTLAAPTLRAAAGASASLSTQYLNLVNATAFSPPLPVGGDGVFSASAGLIDIEGKIAFSGWERATLNAAGDVRLKGTFFETGAVELTGLLTTTGSLQIDASQVYPTSAADFTISVLGADGRIGIGRSNHAAPGTVLSAAGSLTLRAGEIEQAGVLRAPFGRIVLDASRELMLAAGSSTSVAGDGQALLFGRTELSGRSVVYGLGPSTNFRYTQTPEKRVDLRSPSVTLAAGAGIDISGGGDLLAYEFVPGPGGTRDVLSAADAPTTFAILPNLGAWYAPYDHQEYRSGAAPALAVGDAIQLSAALVFSRADSPLFKGMPEEVRTLAAGTYTLLPARYGLLPGAFLVNVVAGSTDRPSGSVTLQADGSRIVSGHRAVTATQGALRTGRSVGFSVRPAETAHMLSEYAMTSLASALSPSGSGLAPSDAGVLAIAASSALVFGGEVRTAHAPASAGARIDIAAPKLAVAAADAVGIDEDYLRIDPARLNALGADSLLLGATRSSGAAGTRLAVTASDIVVANAGTSVLQGPEIVLAATDTIRVDENAAIAGKGTTGLTAPAYLVGDAATDGNGALLRVASEPQASVARSNANGSRGTLSVAAGANLSADGAILLDATRDSTLDGNLMLASGGALALSAGRVSLGDADRVSQGLVLSSAQLGVLARLGELTLRSYSTVDFFGAVSVGSPSLETLSLDAAGIGGYRGTMRGESPGVALHGKQIRLSNASGTLFGNAPLLSDGSTAIAGGGQAALHAGTIEIGSGGSDATVAAFTLKGFDRVALTADREILGSGRGGLAVEGELRFDAGRITVATGGDQTWSATQSMRVGSVPTPAPLPPNSSLGAKLALAGRSVEVGGLVDLPSGVLTVAALGNAAEDGVSMTQGGKLSVRGSSVDFDGVVVPSPGGQVRISSAAGNVTIGSGSIVDVGAATGADAGRLSISAAAGSLVLDGRLIGGAESASSSVDPTRQGSFALDVRSLNDFTRLNDALNARIDGDGRLVSGGFDASRELRVRSGDVLVAATDRVRAHELILAVDDGNLRIEGSIDATGPKGGRIELHAGELTLGRGSIDVLGALDARALSGPTGLGGTAGRGGIVEIGISSSAAGMGLGSATNARIRLAQSSAIDVSGAGSGQGGSVTLRAPRLGTGAGTGVAVGSMAGSIAGADAIVVEAYKVYNANAITAAGATVDGGNFNVSATGAAANTVAFREAGNFVTGSGASIRGVLGQTDNPAFHLRPGIEIRSSGDLTVSINETAAQHLRGWNLAPWRFGGEPGVLTLRAAGNVRFDSSIGDGFDALTNQPMQAWTTQRADASWAYRVTAGADLAAADPMAVRAGVGDVVLAAGKLLRTGTGAIEVTAGRDLALAASTSVIYTAGRTGPAIPDYASPVYRNESNTALRAAYPVDGGDVRIAVGRDLTGIAGSQFISDWLMQRAAQREADGVVRVLNPQTNWWPRVQTFEQGIATLAGGDILAVAGRDIRNLSLSAPTNGVLAGPANETPDLAHLVVRGGGDLRVQAGGDILGGVYLAMAGAVDMVAGGSIAAGTRSGANNTTFSVAPVFALGDAQATVRANGSLALGAVVDPTLVPQRLRTGGTPLSGRDLNAFASYTAATSVHALALGGNLILVNDDNALAQTAPQIFGANTNQPVLTLYPGTLQAVALRADVDVIDGYTLFPAATGNLSLLASGGITSRGTIKMSDVSPSALPSLAAPTTGFVSSVLSGQGRYDAGVAVHTNPPLHAEDAAPVRFVAASGDIEFIDGSQVILPKRLRMIAGADIVNPDLGLQHVQHEDISVLWAGRDIVSTSPIGPSGVPGTNDRTILLGGPGELQLRVGRDLDLGTSSGILTRGALDNPALPDQGASISVLAGVKNAPDYEGFLAAYVDAGGTNALAYAAELAAFVRGRVNDASLGADQSLAIFRAMPAAQRASFAHQVLIAELKAAGRDATELGTGDAASYARGYRAIDRLFPGTAAQTGGGDINLFFSQIKTEQGGDIRLLAPAGLVNAGLANQGRFTKSARDLGIVTIAGGSIEAMSREDFLVNQSRVFTLGGGNITLWSSNGNIDAGRGSKTAAATPPPQFKIDGNGVFSLDISQSIAGSGIGVLLARPGVTPGDVDLIAPRGEVNAGDAGIRAAGNLNVAALRVVDNGNISVGGRATGVPTADTTSLGAGLAVAGTSAVESSRSGDQATRSIADSAQASQQLKDAFRTSLLTVEVLGFGE